MPPTQPTDETTPPSEQLAEYERVLLERDRDIQFLIRQANDNNRWSQVAAEVSSQIGSLDDIDRAVVTLTTAMTQRLGFEFALAQRGVATHESPSVPADVSNRLRSIAHQHREVPLVTTAATGPIAIAFRIAIPSLASPEEEVALVVARSSKTAPAQAQADQSTPARLARLAELVGPAFDSVRLRHDLVFERDGLQHAVAEATAELREAAAAAESARAAAVKAASVRSEFLANMSHEIRTPMTAILGYAALLEDDTVSKSDRQAYLTTIAQSGQYLLCLVDDILNLARLESGRFSVSPTAVSPHRLIAEVHALLAIKAAEKGLDLQMTASDLPDVIKLDGARFRQILINLVGNAVKFTDHGGVTITATADQGNLCVDVRDTGPGISDEKQRTIFAAFEQGNQSLSREHGGAGLGLAIARKIARHMGGDILLSSSLGHGSTFRLRLPIESNELAQPRAMPQPVEIATPVKAYALIVEDTEVNRKLFRTILERAGLTIVEAEDGAQAVELVRASFDEGIPFDMVFMDMQMPIMDGYEASRRIRSMSETLPIVALTAHAMASDRERCLQAGCTEFLTKPVTRGALVEMARKFSGVERAQKAVLKQAPTSSGGLHLSWATDDIVVALLPSFLESLRKQVKEIVAFHGAENKAAVGDLAHQIKGTAATFGFGPISDVAAELERICRGQSEGDYGNMVAILVAECARAG